MRLALDAKTVGRGLVYGAALLLCYALKRFFSQAGAADLGWILSPSCRLATLLGGIDFKPEAGAGFISHAHHLVVGPACAGVNFLIVCFVALFFPLASRFTFRAGVQGDLCWLLISAAAAYGAALLTNALRIVVAVELYGLDVYGEHLTPALLHHAAGTVIYCGALLGLYAGAEALVGLPTPRSSRPARSGVMGLALRWRPHRAPPDSAASKLHAGSHRTGRRLIPLGVYLAMTVGVPIATRAYRDDGERFLLHAGLVTAIAFIVGLVSLLVGFAVDRSDPRPRPPG